MIAVQIVSDLGVHSVFEVDGGAEVERLHAILVDDDEVIVSVLNGSVLNCCQESVFIALNNVKNGVILLLSLADGGLVIG